VASSPTLIGHKHNNRVSASRHCYFSSEFTCTLGHFLNEEGYA
jgi:hypothetical protein